LPLLIDFRYASLAFAAMMPLLLRHADGFLRYDYVFA